MTTSCAADLRLARLDSITFAKGTARAPGLLRLWRRRPTRRARLPGLPTRVMTASDDPRVELVAELLHAFYCNRKHAPHHPEVPDQLDEDHARLILAALQLEAVTS
jgi:hypothetical protein